MGEGLVTCYEVVFDGVAREACDIVQVEFFHEVAAVIVCSFSTDVQALSDLSSGVALSDEL